MSKYKQLCLSFTRGRKDRFDYDSELGHFIGKLVNYMAGYLECPKEKLHIIMPQKDASAFFEHNILGAVELTSNTYHLGVGVTLYDQSSEFINDSIFLSFLISPIEPKKFLVKLGSLEESFEIQSDNPEDYRNLYKFIFEKLREYYV